MNSRMWDRMQGTARRPGSWATFAVLLAAFLALAPQGFAASHFAARGGFRMAAMHGGFGQRNRAQRAPRPPARPSRAPRNNNARPRSGPHPQSNAGSRAEMRPGIGRPGQEHLPEWMAQHQNMSPAQQENALRREPGFNRLSPEQQRRVMNRLRTLDARPPAERQRTMMRNEMFERLSPAARQDVRDSAAALARLPPDRQRVVRQAFNDLRDVPPGDRQAVLNSARFQHDYTPQERHMLGSLLSIEPYRPQ